MRLSLGVFKGDRFSVLKQCHVTKKIEIWVTKNKVNVEDGNDVVWMNFMILLIPNIPRLVQAEPYYYRQPSYFIDDKRLVVCSCDENGQAWIYVLGENKLISKVQLDSVVGFWPSHCTYFPSLVPVPRDQKNEAELQTMDSTKTKQKKKAAHEEQLPWELIEEILSRVPLKSLVRLSVVCKRWNVILDDKRFINNHKETFRFILKTKTKIYSVSIDPKIVVRELPWDTLALEYQKTTKLVDCDEFLICNMDQGAVVWNPCLSNFNFSKDRFSRFCDLPCGMSHLRDALVLRIFKGDRFSLLKQCNVTKKTEIWVTKNKVNVEDSRDVVWVNFIRLSIPSFPSLVPTNLYSQQPSYFIDDKRLVVCSCDETGQAWIYVFGENRLINKVRIDSVVGPWPLHCTYFPSLVPVPRDAKIRWTSVSERKYNSEWSRACNREVRMDLTKTKQKKKAAHEEQLPWELLEEILSRVPLKSLVRLRVVCKRWNVILDDKRFINNHKETFRFILKTKSKIYSVSIDPKIVVRELPCDIPDLECQIPTTLVDCDEFLICNMDDGAAVWNPWLKQSTWIRQPRFSLEGICYNGSNRTSDQVSLYKTIWANCTEWRIHDFAFGTWKRSNFNSGDSNQREKGRRKNLHSDMSVSLNGSLFWIAYVDETDPLYLLGRFNFSKERFYTFCYLPCGMSHSRDALVLRVFKGDRFSVLKQCYVTKKVEIWVTKNKVNVENGSDVVWVSFMTFSIPHFPSLVQAEPYSDQQPSYYIDDKRLVMCSCDENGQAWIYVLGENKLISKVHLDSVVDPWPSHCTYFPSLVPVPREKDEAELQV
ncbi:unnamed protein product [Brassica oleracea var. botrytis]